MDLTEAEVKMICFRARDLLMSQPNLLHLSAPIKIVGDIHGQYYDLLRLFEYGGYPPESNYLFLGDYVDRGDHSLEVLSTLLLLKLSHPDTVYLLRGNHEDTMTASIYGFREEMDVKYDDPDLVGENRRALMREVYAGKNDRDLLEEQRCPL